MCWFGDRGDDVNDSNGASKRRVHSRESLSLTGWRISHGALSFRPSSSTCLRERHRWDATALPQREPPLSNCERFNGRGISDEHRQPQSQHTTYTHSDGVGHRAASPHRRPIRRTNNETTTTTTNHARTAPKPRVKMLSVLCAVSVRVSG